jgi:hypothetical protein
VSIRRERIWVARARRSRPSLLANEREYHCEDYLTRFLGEMTAEQMKDDLILVPAADNVPVKLTEYHW